MKEVWDTGAEQGAAETVKYACMQELCASSDASTMLQDVDRGDENDGQSREVTSTPADLGDEAMSVAVASLVGTIDPDLHAPFERLRKDANLMTEELTQSEASMKQVLAVLRVT